MPDTADPVGRMVDLLRAERDRLKNTTRLLADSQPFAGDLSLYCTICGAIQGAGDRHLDTCAWRIAREELGLSTAWPAGGVEPRPARSVEGTVRHTYAVGHEAHRCSCCPGLHVEARHLDGIEGAARCDWLWEQFRTLPAGTRVRLSLAVLDVPGAPKEDGPHA